MTPPICLLPGDNLSNGDLVAVGGLIVELNEFTAREVFFFLIELNPSPSYNVGGFLNFFLPVDDFGFTSGVVALCTREVPKDTGG